MTTMIPRSWLASLILMQAMLFSLACTRPEEARVGGSAPLLSIYYNAEEQATEKSAVSQVLQGQLAEHNIKVTLQPVPSSIFNDRLSKGQFQSTLALWYLDYDDPEGFLTDFYSKSGFRMSKYTNLAYDKAYLGGLLAPSDREKTQNFKKAANIVNNDLAWIPLYSNDELFLLRAGAEGFTSNAYQYYDYRRVGLDDIRAASDVEVQTLDPAQAYDLASKHLVTQSYEGLVALDANSHIVPSLATRWTFSPQHDMLTFYLRPEVTFHRNSSGYFHGGRRLEASDVKASFERLIKSNSPYTYIFDYVKGAADFKTGKARDVTGFEVVAPLIFRIVLTQPFPTILPWLLAPAAYILPRDMPAGYDFSKSSAGTGPFILRSWDGTVARFVANPDYWMNEGGRRLPLAKNLSIQVIKDTNTVLTAFRRGDLDLINVPLALFGEVLDVHGTPKPEWQKFVYREVKLNNLKFLAFNMQASPWGTTAGLRRRVADSIDRQAIVTQLFHGKARVAHSVVPSGLAGF